MERNRSRSGSGFTHAATMDARVMSEHLANPDATISETMWELERTKINTSYNGRIEVPGYSRPVTRRNLGQNRLRRFARASTRTTSAACYFPTMKAPAVSRASLFPPCSRRATSSRGQRPPLIERGHCLLDGVMETKEAPAFAAMDSVITYIRTRSVGSSANSSGSLYWKPFASVSVRIAITS